MTKHWDTTLRKLVRAQPQAFLKLVLPEAHFIRQLPDKLGDIQLEVDVLILAMYEGKEALVNIELQTYYDPKIAERLLRYNVLLTTEYNLPVDSFVIHLLDDTELPRSPLHWTIHGKKKVIDFYYETIELSQMAWEEIYRTGLQGLYPLISLTRDGMQREVVERMFGELGETGKTDLELIAFTLASYKFAKLGLDEQDWLIRRFHKMHDFLVDSPIYQLILQEGQEKGMQQGLQQGIQQGQTLGQRRALEDAIIAITLERFPKLIDLATRKAERIQHPTILQQVLLKISLAPTIEEAREYLLRIDDE